MTELFKPNIIHNPAIVQNTLCKVVQLQTTLVDGGCDNVTSCNKCILDIHNLEEFNQWITIVPLSSHNHPTTNDNTKSISPPLSSDTNTRIS